MSTPEEEFYTTERWQNWLQRLENEGVDLEDEDSARLRLNMQDDAVIAIAKIVSAYDEGELDEEETLAELERVADITLAEVTLEASEDAMMLVEVVQTAVECVIFASEEYVAGGVAEPSVEECLDAAQEAAAAEELNDALGFCVMAGTRIIDGEAFPTEQAETIEAWPVAEWINGLDSLYEAMRDPEVVEEEES